MISFIKNGINLTQKRTKNCPVIKLLRNSYFNSKSGSNKTILLKAISKHSPNKFNVQVCVNDHYKNPHDIHMLLPPFIENVNFDFTTQESKGMEWSKEKKIYSDDSMHILRNTYVSLLISICYPYLSKDDAILMDKWTRFLFSIDDWIDDSDYRKFDINRMIINNERRKSVILDILKGKNVSDILKKSDTYLTNTMGHLFSEFNRIFIERKIPHNEFVKTFFLYLDSLEVEKKYENRNIDFHSITKERIREDSTGGIHVVSCGAILMGIDIQSLNDSNYELIRMRECIARCIGYANDIFSYAKEIKNSELHLKASILRQPNEIEVKNQVILNQINSDCKLYNLEVNSKDSFYSCCMIHNKLFLDFYHLDSLIEVKSIEIEMYISFIQRWFSHPYWAITIPRYNMGLENMDENYIDIFRKECGIDYGTDNIYS